ncbi:MAG: type II toxin-antitoxin system VapC family toxin [Actinomycetota bacterium]|nr:type II toxin-antitoxin system VapC family toxin [Actinomycetota bacterium]MDQ6948054.1 type II toxin-antitoxin system VapC family toxin [Actinomycetota bacterium]
MIVVDTNVVSELMKAEPSSTVQAWVIERGRRELCTTAITVAEILYGIERLAEGKRRRTLREAAVGVFSRFVEQILPFDAAAATVYAEIVDRRDRRGAPISGFDAQIAAICRTHSASLATRNITDFADVGVELLDPWTSQ